MFFFQEFLKVCYLSLANTRLLLVIKKNYQPIGVTVHSHCVENFEGLLQRCRWGRGCSFPEHPVQNVPSDGKSNMWRLLFNSKSSIVQADQKNWFPTTWRISAPDMFVFKFFCLCLQSYLWWPLTTGGWAGCSQDVRFVQNS